MKLPDALLLLLDNNPFMQFGLRHRLFNLTRLGSYLQPQIEARLKKEVQASAIVMGLSRVQREFAGKEVAGHTEFRLDNIVVHSNLCVITFAKTKESHRAVNAQYNRIQKSGGYITITEGIREITLIVDNRDLSWLDSFPVKPLSFRPSVASVGVAFDESYSETPGLFYMIFQQLYLQKVNIIELASTANELILYLHEEDVRLAFDTLYHRFVKAK